MIGDMYVIGGFVCLGVPSLNKCCHTIFVILKPNKVKLNLFVNCFLARRFEFATLVSGLKPQIAQPLFEF